ncbi:hypothetical protein BDZ97DRAFT_1265376 [Flammula alnicola]|nr:hypothetical protein BDZ97DRAFT_1265376 [Flammula alnicola]
MCAYCTCWLRPPSKGREKTADKSIAGYEFFARNLIVPDFLSDVERSSDFPSKLTMNCGPSLNLVRNTHNVARKESIQKPIVVFFSSSTFSVRSSDSLFPAFPSLLGLPEPTKLQMATATEKTRLYGFDLHCRDRCLHLSIYRHHAFFTSIVFMREHIWVLFCC